MKRLICLAMAVIMVLALTLPVMADENKVVTTTASVGGAGAAPTICAKFETPDALVAQGTQILPIPNNPRPVKFYVLADDPNGVADIYGIDVAVFYTIGPKAGQEKFNAQAQRNGTGWVPTNVATAARELKYANGDKVDMNADSPAVTTDDLDIVAALQTLTTQGRLTLGPGMVLGDINSGVIHDVMNGKQIVIEITANMDPCQPSQNYEVRVKATDLGGNSTPSPVINQFEYLCVVALETDFTAINWGVINVGVENLVTGDNNMATLGVPTVRNAGNNRAMIQLNATPMTGAINGKQIKNFDSKMNQLAASDTYGTLAVQHGYIQFNAGLNAIIEEGTVPVVLPPCSTAQIDFSIFPAIPTIQDTYSGTMTITILQYNPSPAPNPAFSVLPTT